MDTAYKTLPDGVALVSAASNEDARGRLLALEHGSPVPFVPVRTFVILDVPAGQPRAGHAFSCHEFLLVLNGSCTVTVDDGQKRLRLRLRAKEYGLNVSPGVWVGLDDFECGTVLMVLASKSFCDTQYFPNPQPALIAAHALQA
ncbi:MAG: FdtA/QdtA family cupin domain-containing protein [Proteobacteria bacterium]|nr:FdtA/QdtA family cupin domain-containing protein [Burkholderiales bacterium]